MELTIRYKNATRYDSVKTFKEEDLEDEFLQEIKLLKTEGLITAPPQAVQFILKKIGISEVKE